MFINFTVSEQDEELEKTIWLAGRKVKVQYFPEYNETFIFPINPKNEFRKGKTFANYIKRITDLGFDIVGGHYYSIAVAGDLIDDLFLMKLLKEKK